MSADTSFIFVQNAHTNNLKNIDISIPKHKVVVFTGVSGSGKSSLLFDTIYTEAQRQLIETFSTFARTRMPKLSRPDVDDILNLSTAIVIDQKKMGSNLRSTVGTATEINTYLRLLYSRIGQPYIGPSFLFSFNHPQGMCPQCKGLGKTTRINLDLFLDKSKSIREGGITHGHYKPGNYLWKELIALEIFDADKKLSDFTDDELNKLLYSEPFPIKNAKDKLTYNRTFEGLARKLENAIAGRGEDEAPDDEKNAYTRYFTYAVCAACNGSRISEAARSVSLNGISIDVLCRMELTEVYHFLSDISGDITTPVIRKAMYVLEQLIASGVGYLSLERPVGTLSGGESQRVKMARQLDCNLTDLLYVLDEPSIGLHPRDTANLLQLMYRLKDKGNSVFIVEHDPDIIQAAEWIIDIGPGAGKNGGQVVYNGPAAGLLQSDSITGKYLNRPSTVKRQRRTATSFFDISNASANNLKKVSTRIPVGVLTCVTGVSGSGKSTLIHECFAPAHPEAIVIDQSPIGRTSRGNPATYMGVFDSIRKEFAAETGTEASLFSFNSEGACPKCNGQGSISMELHFLDAVKTTCDACDGKRYKPEVLAIGYKGRNIAEVLDLTIAQALSLFDTPRINTYLKLLSEAGLGYLKLGQPLSTLSGGECQRLKIAAELRNKSNIYIMDEPTTGLHLSDTENFIGIVHRLLAQHNTVIIIEHNPDIILQADWVIDMGPEGGKNGGQILFEGTPEELMNCEKSHTGKFLRTYLYGKI